jgi:hypothetical protein
MDGVPAGHEDLAQYLGLPLSNVPSPDRQAATSFARYYAGEFTRVFNRLGATPRVYWTSKRYRPGSSTAIGPRSTGPQRSLRSAGHQRQPEGGAPSVQVICGRAARSARQLSRGTGPVAYAAAPIR